MRLNQLPKLRAEDFPTEQQSWIGRLFTNLNPFIEAVNYVINGQIDFQDNISSVTKSYTISTFQQFNILWPFIPPPQSLQIVKALKGSNLDGVILLPAWSYDATNKSILVSNILEVTSSGIFVLNGSYQFTVRVTV